MTSESFNRKMIFFFGTFVTYFGFSKVYDKIYPSSFFTTFILSIIFTLSVFGLFYITRMDKEGYSEYTGVSVGLSRGSGYVSADGNGCSVPHKSLEISQGKLCRGGAYMNQGSSDRAKMCRKLASSKKGQAEIDRYNCGVNFNGMPGCGFQYTPLEGGQRCQGCSSCDVDSNGIF